MTRSQGTFGNARADAVAGSSAGREGAGTVGWPTVLDAPGIAVVNFGSSGQSELRTAKTEPDDLNYNRLAYHTAFPWEALDPEVGMAMHYVWRFTDPKVGEAATSSLLNAESTEAVDFPNLRPKLTMLLHKCDDSEWTDEELLL